MQYFTGTTGTVNSYGFGSGQLLATQNYNNCIRTEVGQKRRQQYLTLFQAGMCGIRWAETPVASYDTFNMNLVAVTTAQAVGCTTIAMGNVIIPGLSPDGISPLPLGALATSTAFYDIQCGNAFGHDLSPLPAALICKLILLLF